MFAMSYQFLVLLFAFFYAIFFFFKLRNPPASKDPSASQSHEILYISIMLLLVVVPWIVFALFNSSFRSIDIYGYMSDSQKILQQGNIPQSSLMLENPYYASFPVFTLLVSSLTGISGLTSLQGVYVVNVVIQVLLLLAVWLFIRKNCSGVRFQYIFLGIVAATYANPYLYGYFDTPLPQTMGLCILLLLLIFTSVQNSKRYSVMYLILLPIGLIEITVIPIFLLALILLFIFDTILAKQSSVSARARLALPATILMAYLVYTIAIFPVSGYLRKILSFMADLAKDALSGQVPVTQGLSRGALYPLNALGPALVIGATLSYLILYLQAVRNKKESNNWLGTVAVLALLFIVLGTMRGQFAVWGNAFFSISRYFNLPGYALATVVASWVIANSFEHEKRKWVLILLLAVVILSAVGGLLDPLVF
jgi:hypothetical protein